MKYGQGMFNTVNFLQITTWGQFYYYGLTLTIARISNHTPSKVWEEITYPFPNFTVIEVCEWISNFIPHFVMDVITYLCWD